MPWRVEALVRAVLTHGTDDDAVLEFDAADLKGVEELRDGLVVRLGD